MNNNKTNGAVQSHPLRHDLKTLIRLQLTQAQRKRSIKTLMSGLGVVCL